MKNARRAVSRIGNFNITFLAFIQIRFNFE